MARRAPKEERPFSPVTLGLVEAVAHPRVVPSDKSSDGTAPDMSGTRVVCHARRTQGKHDDGQAIERPGLSRSNCLNREKRVLLSRTEETAVIELVHRLASAGATSLKLSHLLRACILMVRQCECDLVREIQLEAVNQT